MSRFDGVGERGQACAAPAPAAPVNLLWTGGWDSTFRLLHLAYGCGRVVQPYYVIDTGRPSSLLELKAMERVRAALHRLSPDAAALVEPSVVVAIHDIPPDETVRAKIAGLRRRHGHLGEQYEWLARFVRHFAIDGLELCIHADDRAHWFVADHVVRVDDEGGYWRLQDLAPQDDLTLFAGFRFPLLETTKTQMRDLAAAAGYGAAMEETWFCYTPRNGAPCGVCNPCSYTIAEGLAARMPRRARWRHRIRPLYQGVERAGRGARRMLWWLSDRMPGRG